MKAPADARRMSPTWLDAPTEPQMPGRGAQMAAELDYVPLPAALIAQVKKTWSTQITSGGHPLWTGP